ncbi:peroxiredoxin family protein [Methanoplanus sp. FWC-SCC4]|uniref:Peroxiredoxin family protein n=1 Tax=Methanochimaera problematica TaxID=2609417 RepID=A0AA97FA55_9EURY|nr:hypothetical protein [Methanoplanus sp. FWC-SCC4]WOF15680.1 peroxiredoxin family protein [Methanoplanus sp. FWC-SCC4]
MENNSKSKNQTDRFVKILVVILSAIIIISVLVFSEDTKNNNSDYRDYVLSDVLTGENFKINDFEDKPVLITSFTILCPVCTKQQEEIARISGLTDTEFINIGLDLDYNDKPETLKKHIQDNGFNGYYAVSPPELTEKLISEFGELVVQPITAPVIMIHPKCTEPVMFNIGIKNAEYLKDAITQGCLQ